MNDIFQAYLCQFILVFFDDILVYSPSWEAHLLHLCQTLEISAHHHFLVKTSNCVFGQSEVDYLGHIITRDGVKVDSSKIEVMCTWPVPKTITELRGFLGLTGYYHKFVKDYGLIARTLTHLLKKGQFQWSPEVDATFKELKTAISSTLVLGLPNFSDVFVIESDASDKGIGAVLSQNG
jgi:hypothetical protein